MPQTLYFLFKNSLGVRVIRRLAALDREKGRGGRPAAGAFLAGFVIAALVILSLALVYLT